MNNQVKTLRVADREFRNRYIKTFSQSIVLNIPTMRFESSLISRDGVQIRPNPIVNLNRDSTARNIARWHVDQQDSGMIRFCRKHGVKDAVEILWTDDSGSAGVVLTEKNKLLVFDGEKFEEF